MTLELSNCRAWVSVGLFSRSHSQADLPCGLPKAFRRDFAITHFFNPPRYLRLVEIVPAGADEEVVNSLAHFVEESLGKGVVWAKDTPNFVANRIGVHGQMVALNLTEEMSLTVEEVDKLTGTIVGRPKSAMYRTLDIVGLDVGELKLDRQTRLHRRLVATQSK